MIQSKTKLFIDMDGVTAKWNPDASIEDTYKPGYFLAREPEEKLIKAINLYLRTVGPVCILSATYGKSQQLEKLSWLRNQFPSCNILDPGFKRTFESDIETVFCPYGVSKKQFIIDNYEDLLSDVNILMDDFSNNLREWNDPVSKFIGLKFMNDINGTKGTWTGLKMDGRMSTTNQYITLKAISDYYSKVA